MDRLPHAFVAVATPARDLAGAESEAVAVTRALAVARDRGDLGDVIGPPRVLSLDALLKPFRELEHRGRIALFHSAGHGTPEQILLEGPAAGGTGMAGAHATGLAHFLSTQFALKLVFLNACSTRAQARVFIETACLDVVVATSCRVRDDVARAFAEKFYTELATDVSVRVAFVRAEGAVRARYSERLETLLRAEFARKGDGAARGALVWGEEIAEGAPDARPWPWELIENPGTPDAAGWKLSDLREDPNHGLPPCQ